MQVGAGAGMVGVLLARIGASKVPTSVFPRIFHVNLHINVGI